MENNIKQLNARICQPLDTLARWESANPKLLKGERVFVDDNGVLKEKVGDGETFFKDLNFISVPEIKYVELELPQYTENLFTSGSEYASKYEELTKIIPALNEMYIIKYHKVYGLVDGKDKDIYENHPEKKINLTVYITKIGDGKTPLVPIFVNAECDPDADGFIAGLPALSTVVPGTGSGSVIQINELDLFGWLYNGSTQYHVHPIVEGSNSSAFGEFNRVYGSNSTAMNYNNRVEGKNNFVINSGNQVLNDPERLNTNGEQVPTQGSFVAGHKNISKADYQTIVGTYANVDTKDAFVVGNGQNGSNRKNAFKVTKEGDVSITKDLTVTGKLSADGLVMDEGAGTLKASNRFQATNHVIADKGFVRGPEVWAVEKFSIGANAASKDTYSKEDFKKLKNNFEPLYNTNFKDNTIEQVINTIRSGVIPNTWNIGDELVTEIADKERTLVIIGKDADIFADGTTAPFTFHFKDLYEDWKAPMYAADTLDTGSWETSTMRKVIMPSVLESFPSLLKNSIDSVIKYTKTKSGVIQTTEDKLFLLAFPEVHTRPEGDADYCAEIPEKIYGGLDTNAKRIKYNENEVASAWLMRNRRENLTTCMSINEKGERQAAISPTTSAYFAPAFCITNKPFITNERLQELSELAIGKGKGNNSISLNTNSDVSGNFSFSAGIRNTITGGSAVAFGKENVVNDNFSFVVGIGNKSNAINQTILGSYNDTTTIENSLFVIGNGSDTNNRSNLFTVNKDKSITLGETTLTETELQNIKSGNNLNYHIGSEAPSNPTPGMLWFEI